MFCRHCGSKIPDGSKFCENCGISMLRVNPTTPPELVQGSDNGRNPIPILPVNVPPTQVPVHVDGKLMALKVSGILTSSVALEVVAILSEDKVPFSLVYVLLVFLAGISAFITVYSFCKRKIKGGLFVLFLITLIVISIGSIFIMIFWGK